VPVGRERTAELRREAGAEWAMLYCHRRFVVVVGKPAPLTGAANG
jgi:hypothetical protein